MFWEELTAPEFAAAVEKCGRVRALPFGVIEKHGDHLPLGPDILHVRHVAARAAALEPMMVFPM
jgi:creatinine amidohydrolase